jgi:putative transcriptional regulator
LCLRRRQNGGVESQRGKLLIASPSLPDWFRRTVILMVEHVDEGAFGLVLNRPSQSTVVEAVPALADVADPGELVHIGGPVQPDGVVALGEFPDPDQSPKLVLGDVGLVDLEHPPAQLGRIRLFAGHAGWGEGQLDGELEAEAWIVAEPEPGDPFSDGDLWAEALRRQGGQYELLARMPADPSVN